MKTLIAFSVACALLASLTACGDAYSKIDGHNRQSFLDSSADLKAALPEQQRDLFEKSLIYLQHDRSIPELDGMTADEVLEAEADRLSDVRKGRVAKLEKFEAYEKKFIDMGSQVPQDIMTTLAEVRERISMIDEQLAVLEGGPGDNSEAGE